MIVALSEDFEECWPYEPLREIFQLIDRDFAIVIEECMSAISKESGTGVGFAKFINGTQ